VPVSVPEALRGAGLWELTIAPAFQDGRRIKVDPPFTIQVRESGH